jgi:predicted transcriptional regulator
MSCTNDIEVFKSEMLQSVGRREMVRYRPAIKIVLRILECTATRQPIGRALKTHIIQCANLMTTPAEKYLDMLKEAGYILESRENWGELVVILYVLTPLGKERYNWFNRINTELFKPNEWLYE